MKKKKLSRREVLAYGGAALIGSALPRSVAAAEEAAKKKQESLPQVPRKVLGKTGETVPILLMGGSMKFDPRFDPKLAECLRFGVNYIDAADCYAGGTCEPAVGSFLERTKSRKRVWITSKSDEHDPAGFVATVERSLKRMRTDYIDMMYLHALKDPDYLTEDLRKAVDKLKKEGKLRFFGFSCHHGNVAELMQLAAKTPWVESVMFRYNFRQYGDKELNAAIDACAKANVGLIAMKTQGSEASFQDAWKKFETTGKWNKHQAVLKAVWEDERIAAAVSHMDTFEKLKQNIAAALDDEKLGALDRQAIEKYARLTRPEACDGCDHLCNPAVDAPVQIGATLRYLMYHDVYGQPDEAWKLFSSLPEGARQLRQIDFAPAGRACPHGVDVVAQMRRAADVFAV